jgi:hypothetical protein
MWLRDTAWVWVRGRAAGAVSLSRQEGGSNAPAGERLAQSQEVGAQRGGQLLEVTAHAGSFVVISLSEEKANEHLRVKAEAPDIFQSDVP